MTSAPRRTGEALDERGERTGVPFGLSSFLRGLALGGGAALFLGIQVGSYLNRRPVLVFRTDYGNVRVSKDALESIFSARAETVPGVVAARIRSRWWRGRTRINVLLYVDAGVPVESTVAGVVANLYRTVSELTAADEVSAELIIEDIIEL